MSFVDDLRNLDRNNVGGWPRSVKLFFIALLFLFIILAGWYFHISNQQDDLARAQQQEQQLRQEFSQKQQKAANLVELKKQLNQMQDMLRTLLRQLPSKTEMPALLVDISQTALAAGLDTELFEPGPETPKEFYAEQPIKLRMTGTYHQFGAFISGVASLPRVVILTMHDVSLTPVKGGKTGKDGQPLLTLQGTVKTYRYLEEGEQSSGSGKATRRGGK